jgi:hypothetical protein
MAYGGSGGALHPYCAAIARMNARAKLYHGRSISLNSAAGQHHIDSARARRAAAVRKRLTRWRNARQTATAARRVSRSMRRNSNARSKTSATAAQRARRRLRCLARSANRHFICRAACINILALLALAAPPSRRRALAARAWRRAAPRRVARGVSDEK